MAALSIALSSSTRSVYSDPADVIDTKHAACVRKEMRCIMQDFKFD